MTFRSQEWQRLAWAIGAWDLQQDAPVDNDLSNEAEMFRQWAESAHGPAARKHIATHDALMTIRFGPETTPESPQRAEDPWVTAPIPAQTKQLDTAEGFAREVQRILIDHDDDWQVRDEQLIAAVVRYAGQFLPGGQVRWLTDSRQPSPPSPRSVAVAGDSCAGDGSFQVGLVTEGYIEWEPILGPFRTLDEACTVAQKWNDANGVSTEERDQILSIAAGFADEARADQ